MPFTILCGGLLLCIKGACEMNIEMSLLFGAIGTLIGVIGAITATRKNSRNDGEEQASIKNKVDYIARGVDDIRLEIKDHARKIDNHGEKIIRMDESLKQAHKRIDEIGGK